MTDTTAAAATAATATATPQATLATDPGFAKFDADTQGWLKNKGWDGKPHMDAIAEMTKSYREYERYRGVPEDQIARIPKADAPEAEKAAFWQRLGAGSKPEDYDFKDVVKFSDGSDELDAALVDALRARFPAIGVTKAQASEIVKAVREFAETDVKNDTANTQAKIKEEADALKKSWGANMTVNTVIADKAAEALGWGKDFLQRLAASGAIGQAQIAQGLLIAGQRMGEARFVQSPSGGNGAAMTKEQAQAQLNTLLADTKWAERLQSGDTTARREFNDLTALMAA